jgi:hypothetical protein
VGGEEKRRRKRRKTPLLQRVTRRGIPERISGDSITLLPSAGHCEDVLIRVKSDKPLVDKHKKVLLPQV